MTFYTRTLAVPARRDVGLPDTRAGQQTFEEIGCASCHVGELRTDDSDIAALDGQVIRPYTDLLLHDMGAGLADGRPELDGTGAVVGTPDLDPSGQEWRTPPLWGIGLVETVNGHTRFLHDGRARSLEEAILWHGGEAESGSRPLPRAGRGPSAPPSSPSWRACDRPPPPPAGPPPGRRARRWAPAATTSRPTTPTPPWRSRTCWPPPPTR